MSAHKTGGGGSVVYYQPRYGVFVNRDGEEFKRITGRLNRISLHDDPGDKSKQIKPGVKINVSLTDDQEISVISCRIENIFGMMLAQSLSAVGKNAELEIGISQGKENEKVSFAWVKYWDGDSAHPISNRPEYPKDYDERAKRAIADMKAHPAFSDGTDVPKPEEADYDPFADE